MTRTVAPEKWDNVTKHEGPGMTAYVRTIGFEHTGNNEGTIEWEVAVCTHTGDLLLHEFVYREWEYHTALDVHFAEDGSSVSLAVSNGQTRAFPLDGGVL